ncbi:Integrin alpha-10 [Anabarilius grahami]|uniref:Integrin alpha-10 n=1 Tax=Anabarilius grahami TaxID=495550 RepID=A0A3N0XL46_ANAGA|nr:Integrin alpha-10 [Anabarilius grahami]
MEIHKYLLLLKITVLLKAMFFCALDREHRTLTPIAPSARRASVCDCHTCSAADRAYSLAKASSRSQEGDAAHSSGECQEPEEGFKVSLKQSLALPPVTVLVEVPPSSGLCECFNIDVKRPRIFIGPEDALFGFSVLQHENNGEKSILVGAPWDGPQNNRKGDIYKCIVEDEINSNCSKVNLGENAFQNMSRNLKNSHLGMTLTPAASDGFLPKLNFKKAFLRGPTEAAKASGTSFSEEKVVPLRECGQGTKGNLGQSLRGERSHP